jgi:hypothetical protein
LTFEPLHIVTLDVPKIPEETKGRQAVKLTLPSSGRSPREPTCKKSVRRNEKPDRPHIPSLDRDVKEPSDKAAGACVCFDAPSTELAAVPDRVTAAAALAAGEGVSMGFSRGRQRASVKKIT